MSLFLGCHWYPTKEATKKKQSNTFVSPSIFACTVTRKNSVCVLTVNFPFTHEHRQHSFGFNKVVDAILYNKNYKYKQYSYTRNIVAHSVVYSEQEYVPYHDGGYYNDDEP